MNMKTFDKVLNTVIEALYESCPTLPRTMPWTRRNEHTPTTRIAIPYRVESQVAVNAIKNLPGVKDIEFQEKHSQKIMFFCYENIQFGFLYESPHMILDPTNAGMRIFELYTGVEDVE